MSDDRIRQLAETAGLMVDWQDAAGHAKTVTPEALRAILTAIDVACGTASDVEDSLARLGGERAPRDFVTGEIGRATAVDGGTAGASARIALEDGSLRDIRLEAIGHGVGVPAIEVAGYHRLELGDRTITLAIAPDRCWSIADAAPGRTLWGTAVQVYALNERPGSAFGDFGALAAFAGATARIGADAIAISPVHALFPADPARYSPYAPSTRLFLNPLFADPALLGGTSAEQVAAEPLIDWRSAIPRRLAALRMQFDDLERRDDPATRQSIDAFVQTGGADLRLHAVYDAVHAHFFAQSGARGWQDWPVAFRDPHGPAVAAFARDNAVEVRFHLFLQWLADRSLAAAQGAARDGGMAIGLVADLAVGMDAGGSHAWSRREDLLTGLSVGAPPDIFQPAGQGWGITTFSPESLRRTGFAPFLATIRAAMAHAGGVRIDHAMGLQRLWVVPDGASPQEGAYLRYPVDEMLRLVALESQRHRAVVIAEDLGTVAPGFREALDAKAIMGMRVLWFERTAEGGFTPPAKWSRDAAALTTTHDLPTVAGWWTGRDIEWTFDLGRKSNFETADAAKADRAQDRQRLWDACLAAGAASGAPPAADAPQAAVDAMLELIAQTPCQLAIAPIEDLLGLDEQPNVPGTIDEHPNWRRRLAGPAETLFGATEVAGRIARLSAARHA
ncbi:MAG: malQ [Sphingomonas bacterium]|nr:malQ [Sphingomonas bacterium]